MYGRGGSRRRDRERHVRHPFGDHGDQGVHVRARVSGTADLFDSDDNLVGTWTYRLAFTDQIPPDGQGATHFTTSGPVTCVDGRTAILHVFHHHVFDKGDVEKFPARDTAACGGIKLGQLAGILTS